MKFNTICYVSLVFLLLFLSCGPKTEVTADKADPDLARQLSQIWSKSDPGKIGPEKVEEITSLIDCILPDVTDLVPGAAWHADFFDGDSGDFFSVDLLRNQNGKEERVMWFHILYRSDMSEQQKAGYGNEDFEGFKGMGAKDTHFFFLVGNVEIRAVANSEDFKNDEKIRQVLRKFDLETISKL